MYGLILASIGGADRGHVGRLLERGQLRLLGPHRDGDGPTYTLVNSSGAVLGGDRLRVDLTVARQARFSTVGATLLHAGRPSFTRTRLRVAPGALLEWLPGSLLPMAGSQHRQQTTIEVAAGGILLAAEILQAGPLSDPNAAPTSLATRIKASYAGQAVYREQATYTSTNAPQWGEFRCLGTILALGEPFNSSLVEEMSALWQKQGLWGAFSTLVSGGISGKVLTQHPQDCREAITEAAGHLRRIRCS